MQMLARERPTGILYLVTMPYNSKEQTPYDQFNLEIPEQFPAEGISAKAAKAIVTSETWTDANPMLNLSSFVTTFCEPEAKDIHDASMFRNFADPDMYPHTKETEFKCVKWLHDLWNGPRQAEPLRCCDDWLLGGLHARRPRPQMELAPSAAEGQKRCEPAEHGYRRQRSDRLEKIYALL
jgi:hypothetical protein